MTAARQLAEFDAKARRREETGDDGARQLAEFDAKAQRREETGNDGAAVARFGLITTRRNPRFHEGGTCGFPLSRE